MPKKHKHLDAKGKGEFSYDYRNDILLFKTKNRDYQKSIDFDNFTLDIDTKGFITGIRIFDASKIFGLSKMALNNIKQFEFNTRAEEKVITIQLKFMSVLRNKPQIIGGENFVREAFRSKIEDSELICTAAA